MRSYSDLNTCPAVLDCLCCSGLGSSTHVSSICSSPQRLSDGPRCSHKWNTSATTGATVTTTTTGLHAKSGQDGRLYWLLQLFPSVTRYTIQECKRVSSSETPLHKGALKTCHMTEKSPVLGDRSYGFLYNTFSCILLSFPPCLTSLYLFTLASLEWYPLQKAQGRAEAFPFGYLPINLG